MKLNNEQRGELMVRAVDHALGNVGTSMAGAFLWGVNHRLDGKPNPANDSIQRQQGWKWADDEISKRLPKVSKGFLLEQAWEMLWKQAYIGEATDRDDFLLGADLVAEGRTPNAGDKEHVRKGYIFAQKLATEHGQVVPDIEPLAEPWTFETMPVAVKVRNKNTGELRLARPHDKTSAYVGGVQYPYLRMMEKFVQLDGSPCGVVAAKKEERVPIPTENDPAIDEPLEDAQDEPAAPDEE